MADTLKKAKTPAKPRKPAAKIELVATPAAKARKPAAKKQKAALAAMPAMPSREQIEELARRYWAQRGYQDGYAEQDWLRAEQELLQMAS